MAVMLKGLLSELLFGNIGVAIPTYVRNDNYRITQQAESTKQVHNGKDRMVFSRVIGGIRKQFSVGLGALTEKA